MSGERLYSLIKLGLWAVMPTEAHPTMSPLGRLRNGGLGSRAVGKLPFKAIITAIAIKPSSHLNAMIRL
jgi:hypothetical protein